jgi:hypothetical protein
MMTWPQPGHRNHCPSSFTLIISKQWGHVIASCIGSDIAAIYLILCGRERNVVGTLMLVKLFKQVLLRSGSVV